MKGNKSAAPVRRVTMLSGVMLLLLLVVHAGFGQERVAVTSDSIYISVPDSLIASPGDTISVPVYLSRQGNDVAALGAVLKATGNFLTFVDFTQGPIVPGPVFNVNSPAPDSVRLGFFNAGSGNIVQDGELVGLRFAVDAAALSGSVAQFLFSELSASDPNFVNLTVIGISGKLVVNSPPQINPISDQSMNEGDTLTVSVQANDPDLDLLVLSVDNLPAFGSFVDNGDGTGQIAFYPGFADAGEYPDIRVTVTDSLGLIDSTSFKLTVLNTNRLPEAVDDSVATAEDMAVVINVLSNDSDADGDSLFVVSFTQGANGTVSNNADGTLTYAPGANFFGVDLFSYLVSDGNGGLDSALVVVTVAPVNDPPQLSGLPESISFDADTTFILNLWPFASDVETPDTLLVFDVTTSNDSLLTAYDSTNGNLTLSAVPGFVGSADLYITVLDEAGAADSDTVLVTVNPPTAINSPGNKLPTRFMLYPNYPNPFNPTTAIPYDLPRRALVDLSVYNILGQKVRTLIHARQKAGRHVARWDGRNDWGRYVTSGIYLVRFKADNYLATRRLTLLR